MNQRELNIRRKQNWYKYKTPGCSNLHRRKINAIFLNPTNSKKHELGKCEVCYDLQAKGHKFITEAATCKGDRRVDVVDIDNGEQIEIETDPKRAARFANMDVTVIMV